MHTFERLFAFKFAACVDASVCACVRACVDARARAYVRVMIQGC